MSKECTRENEERETHKASSSINLEGTLDLYGEKEVRIGPDESRLSKAHTGMDQMTRKQGW